MPLGKAAKGFKGKIESVNAKNCTAGLSEPELERRLAEMGFVEGSTVEILHEGLWGRDPIAVKVDNVTVALRRRTANAIKVSAAPSSSPCAG